MNCKNCKNEISQEASFCNNCGAKVINNRLTFKLVTEEFFTTYLSWDNKFFKTFIHMLTKPHNVVNSYLNGVRKRYMQPFAFLIISLTLVGIFMFFAKEQFQEYNETLSSYFKTNNHNAQNDEFMKKVNDFSMNYFNLITFAMIPFFALINLLVFYKKQNFIEQNISIVYSYASYEFVFVIVASIGVFLSIPLIYIIPYSMLYLLLYHIYFFKKLFKLTIWQIFYKTLFFIFLLSLLYIIISIVGTFILIKTGVFKI